jgi:hypothetical protein
MKIYIAGPMTGYDQWNFPAFFEAEKQLLSLGCQVINPAHNDGPTLELALESAGVPERPNHSWAWYMRRDLPHVLEVDALCVLPGWQKSKGASLEVQVDEAMGLPIYVLQDGKLIPRVRVLGLSGWARSGKDSVAEFLEKEYGYTKASFAKPMKDALVILNPMIDVFENRANLAGCVDKLGWDYLKDASTEIRPLLQRMGTEVGREMFGEDFWVDHALSSIPDGAKVVFSDVRYPNEADAVRKLGGQVWRIERDGYGPANDHTSEHALNKYNFDQRIYNDSDLESLWEKVGVLCRELP